jgi:hypothetical protein
MDASEIDAGLREQIMGVAQTWLASQVLTLQVSEQHGDDGALQYSARSRLGDNDTSRSQ